MFALQLAAIQPQVMTIPNELRAPYKSTATNCGFSCIAAMGIADAGAASRSRNIGAGRAYDRIKLKSWRWLLAYDSAPMKSWLSSEQGVWVKSTARATHA